MKSFKFSLNNIIKLIVIISLVVAASTKQQYSYYTYIRWLVMTTSIYFAYSSFDKKQNGLLIYFIAIAVLFNPFQKFWFQKEIWHLIDYMVAIVTTVTIFYDKKILKDDTPS